MQKETTKSRRALAAAGLLVLFAVVVVFGVVFVYRVLERSPTAQTTDFSPQQGFRELTIGDNVVKIELATTNTQKNKGLCCRDYLAKDRGMLFVYDEPGDYSFWMKDTKIPLDMYWISSTKQIVHIEHLVQPSSYPQTFSSPVPAQYILETNAGYVQKHNVKVGDLVSF